MKIKNLLSVAAFLAPAVAIAMPATPEVLVKTNPDGKQVRIRAHGNYQFNYVTDEDGLYIMELSTDGYWKRAVRNGAYLMNVEADIERLMEEKFGSATPMRPEVKTFDFDENGQSTFPTIGDNVHSLVVLLEYPDIPFTMDDPVDFYSRYLNEEGFEAEDLKGSARDFFIANSNGKFKPTFEVVKYNMPQDHTYYAGSDSKWHSTLEGVLRDLDKDIDFSRYDFDEDGLIDTVYFIYSGYGQADTQDTNYIWPHQSSLQSRRLMLDGKQASNYACSNSLRGGIHYINKDNFLTGIGTFCHEFSHVLGIPDLYHTKDPNAAMAPGKWTIMADGPYNDDGRTPPSYSAYERYICKWVDLEEAEAGKSYTLKPIVDESRGIRVSIPRRLGGNLKDEFYVIENRTKKGYDEFLEDSGMLIWHVDFLKSAWIGNTVNNDPNRPRCMVFFPQGGNRSEAAWPYKKTGTTYTYDFIGGGYPTQLKAASNLGNTDEIFITNIKYDKDTQEVSFDFNNVEGAYDEAPQNLVIDRLKNDAGKYTSNFTAKWDPVPGATDYRVNIVCKSGKDIIVGGVDKKSTEGKCETEFNLSGGMLTLPIIVDVYAENGVLPSKTPTTLTFVPNDIKGWPYNGTSGIEEISGEEAAAATICGGIGEVIAPAGAEVYTLNGVRTGKENLPAGVYIVRYGDRVEKVFVK